MVKSILVVAVFYSAIFSVVFAGTPTSYILKMESFSDNACTQRIGEYRTLVNTGSGCPYPSPTACTALGTNYVIQSCAPDYTLPDTYYVRFYTSNGPCPSISSSYGLVNADACMDYDVSKSFTANCGTLNDYFSSLGCTGAITPYTYTAEGSTCTDYMVYSASYICAVPPVNPPVDPPVDAPVNPPVDPPMAAPVAEPMAEPMVAPMTPPMAAPVAAPVAKTPVRKTSTASGFVNASLAVVVGVTIALF